MSPTPYPDRQRLLLSRPQFPTPASPSLHPSDKSLLVELAGAGRGCPETRPTHGEAVESPRVRHVVGGGGADRCVVLRVPQGRRRHRRAGLLGCVVVVVEVRRRGVVMMRVAHARAERRVPRPRRERSLEQGQGPRAPGRPAPRGPPEPRARTRSTARDCGRPSGVQVRGDAERAHAEGAALAGRAARGPGHGHQQRGRHAQRDEEVRPGVRLWQRGRWPRRVLNDERIHIEGARHGHEGCGQGAGARRQAPGDVEVSASRRQTKGSRERSGPRVPRAAPQLRGFIAPTPARDAAERRSLRRPSSPPPSG